MMTRHQSAVPAQSRPPGRTTGFRRLQDVILLPIAVPVLVHSLIYRTRPDLHGTPAYLFLALKGFGYFMLIPTVLWLLSLVFPFSYPVSDFVVGTQDGMRSDFLANCEHRTSGACFLWDPADMEPMGVLLYVATFIALIPIGFLSHLPHNQWQLDIYASQASAFLFQFWTEGSIGPAFFLMMASWYWMMALMPLWLLIGGVGLLWNLL